MRYDYPRGSAAGQLIDWAQRLTNDLNRYADTGAAYPGPYANDAAAATGGIPIGSSYMDSAGIYRRRLT
jgi:hypothetical protein